MCGFAGGDPARQIHCSGVAAHVDVEVIVIDAVDDDDFFVSRREGAYKPDAAISDVASGSDLPTGSFLSNPVWSYLRLRAWGLSTGTRARRALGDRAPNQTPDITRIAPATP